MNGFLESWTFLTHLVMGSLLGPINTTERFAFDTNFEFWDYPHSSIQTLNILDDSSQQMTPFPTIRTKCFLDDSSQQMAPFPTLWLANMFSGPTNMLSTMIPLTMKNSGLIWVWSMLILLRKPLDNPLNGEFQFPTHFL